MYLNLSCSSDEVALELVPELVLVDLHPKFLISILLLSRASLNKGPPVPIWGNAATMNINPLIVGNIQGSPYFKVQLMDCRTYQEVVDEIYYRVDHLEPWERGTRVRP